MGRSRSNTRRTASARPRGTLSLKRGGYGFVQTAEGGRVVPSRSNVVATGSCKPLKVNISFLLEK